MKCTSGTATPAAVARRRMDVANAKYFCGYPRQHLRQLVSGIAATLGCLTPLLALATTGLVLRTLAFRETRSFFDLAAAVFCLVFVAVWIGAIWSGVRDSFVARIVPYFEGRVGLASAQSFAAGLALARNAERVDQLASSLGIEPISSFGYADDGASWYEAAMGLRVIVRLREALESGVVTWDDAAAVRDDLLHIEQALAAADGRGIRFCFVLRSGRDHFISGREMSVRAGSFW